MAIERFVSLDNDMVESPIRVIRLTWMRQMLKRAEQMFFFGGGASGGHSESLNYARWSSRDDYIDYVRLHVKLTNQS